MKLDIGVLHENLPISRHFRDNRLINSRTLLEGVNEICPYVTRPIWLKFGGEGVYI